MKKIVSVLMLLFPLLLNAQQIDSVHSQNDKSLEQRLDSLQQTIARMTDEMQHIKKKLNDENSGINDMLAIIGTDNDEPSDFEKYSRYKRINDLLNAIEQQPGKLIFKGNVTTMNQFSLVKKKVESFGTASLDIFATTSFGKGTLLFVDLEAIGGDGPDFLHPGFSSLNGDAGSTQSADSIDRINIVEAWGEFSLFQDIITITLGKIDMTNYFDNNASANDETLQFISGAFINNSSFAVPSSSPGIRFRTTILQRFHIQFGLSSQDNNGLSLYHDLYKVAGVGWTIAPGTGFESNIRIFAYQIPDADNDYGFGVSYDKVFSEKFNVFGRYGFNRDAVADYWGLKSSWSTGFSFVTKIKKQPFAVGLAYGENFPMITELRKEQIAELYIRRQLNKWVHISPHLQFVLNQGGANDQLLIFSFRAHLNF